MKVSEDGHMGIVQLLVDAKADVNAKDMVVSCTTHDILG
jgi:hypothetical protein